MGRKRKTAAKRARTGDAAAAAPDSEGGDDEDEAPPHQLRPPDPPPPPDPAWNREEELHFDMVRRFEGANEQPTPDSGQRTTKKRLSSILHPWAVDAIRDIVLEANKLRRHVLFACALHERVCLEVYILGGPLWRAHACNKTFLDELFRLLCDRMPPAHPVAVIGHHSPIYSAVQEVQEAYEDYYPLLVSTNDTQPVDPSRFRGVLDDIAKKIVSNQTTVLRTAWNRLIVCYVDNLFDSRRQLRVLLVGSAAHSSFLAQLWAGYCGIAAGIAPPGSPLLQRALPAAPSMARVDELLPAMLVMLRYLERNNGKMLQCTILETEIAATHIFFDTMSLLDLITAPFVRERGALRTSRHRRASPLPGHVDLPPEARRALSRPLNKQAIWHEIAVKNMFNMGSSRLFSGSFETDSVDICLHYSVPASTAVPVQHIEALTPAERHALGGRPVVAGDLGLDTVVQLAGKLPGAPQSRKEHASGCRFLRLTSNEIRFSSKSRMFQRQRDSFGNVVVDALPVLGGIMPRTRDDVLVTIAAAPSAKTTFLTFFLLYLEAKLRANIALHDHYNIYHNQIYLRLRWYEWVNRERLIAGFMDRVRTTYGANAIIVLGNWSCGSWHHPGREPQKGVGWRRIFRHAGFTVFIADEWGTSKHCCECCNGNAVCRNTVRVPDPQPWHRADHHHHHGHHHFALPPAPAVVLPVGAPLPSRLPRAGQHGIVPPWMRPTQPCHGLLQCSWCRRFFERDSAAAQNILLIATEALAGRGRPLFLQRH